MGMSKMISLLTSTIKELGAHRGPRDNASPNRTVENMAPSFFDGLGSNPTLQQERHEYNMEGLFSPHNLPLANSEDLIWINNSFLKKNEKCG